MHFLGINGHGHVDNLCGDAVADGAREFGLPKGRCGNGVLHTRIVEQVGWRPIVSVVARAVDGVGVKGGRAVLADFAGFGDGRCRHVGAFHVHHYLLGAGAAPVNTRYGDGVHLRRGEGHGLGGLIVGVGHHVGRFPMVGVVPCWCRIGSEGCGAAEDDLGGVRRYGNSRDGINGHCQSDFIYAPATRLYGMCHIVGARSGVSVCRVLGVVGGAVAKIPFITCDFMPQGVGGGCAGELGGRAFANGGEFEIGDRHGIDDDLGRAGGGLSINGCHTGIGAGHFHSAVR